MKKACITGIVLIWTMIMCMGHCLAEEQTVLLYMLGCDLEAASGAVAGDLMEIMRVTEAYPVRVVVYLGGSETWWLPGLEDGHCYDAEIKNGSLTILEDHGNRPSGGSGHLRRFLSAYGRSGADLILWGHGFGDGIGVDALRDNDRLTLAEIRESLSAVGLHFRLIGFDACGMATLEAAWMAAPYADCFAASKSEEALSGWNYAAVLPCLSGGGTLPEASLRLAFRRGSRRASDDFTVLSAKAMTDGAPYLIRVLDGSMNTVQPASLSALAAACADREAGEAVLKMLDGQDLIIAGTGVPGDDGPAGLAESYQAFVRRR